MTNDAQRLADLYLLRAKVNAEIAAMEAKRCIKRTRRRATVAQCGTESGYFRHCRTGTPTCDECRAAHAAAERIRYDLRRVREEEEEVA